MVTGLLWSSPLNDQSPRIVTRMTKTTSLVRVSLLQGSIKLTIAVDLPPLPSLTVYVKVSV